MAQFNYQTYESIIAKAQNNPESSNGTSKISYFKLGENEQLYQGNLEEETNVKWNQFELNKQKYNVTSTYNENNYTTQLDPNMIPQEHKMKTEKIIKEIYSSPAESTNIHVLEDRGLVAANEDMDEEDKYSSVLRQNNNNK